MSALSFLQQKERLVCIADTAGCSADGVLRYSLSKLRLCAKFPGVIGITGRAHIGLRVQEALAGCASFDEMIKVAPARFGEIAGEDDAVAIGGFSEARDALEVWYARAGRQGVPLHKDESIFCGQPATPWHTSSDALPFLDDVDRFAMAVFNEQRLVTWGREEGFPPGTHVVGGRGEIAELTRESASIRTLIEWDDEIGKPIKPTPTPVATVNDFAVAGARFGIELKQNDGAVVLDIIKVREAELRQIGADAYSIAAYMRAAGVAYGINRHQRRAMARA